MASLRVKYLKIKTFFLTCFFNKKAIVSIQVSRPGMNMNPANQGSSQGALIPGNMNNTGITGGGGGLSGGKTNPGANMASLSQQGNGGPGSMGQNIPPQNKDDKS